MATAGTPTRPQDFGAGYEGPVRAPRGTDFKAANWLLEAPRRMLLNNLDPEVGELPEQLVVYGGTGRAARSWEAVRAILDTLERMKPDETLLVQSGKPVAVFTTHEDAPRVLLANSHLVPKWATRDEHARLEALGLTMYGQMTAGSWIYIGTQGILQGTYETLGALAEQKGWDDGLTGTITLTAGLGGMVRPSSLRVRSRCAQEPTSVRLPSYTARQERGMRPSALWRKGCVSLWLADTGRSTQAWCVTPRPGHC